MRESDSTYSELRSINLVLMFSEDVDLLGVEEDKAGDDDVDGQGEDVVNSLYKLELEEGEGHIEDE